jgi:hypothetical protein
VPITTKSWEFDSRSWWGVLDTTLCAKVCQWLATGQCFSPISSTNKTDPYDITDRTPSKQIHILIHIFISYGVIIFSLSIFDQSGNHIFQYLKNFLWTFLNDYITRWPLTIPILEAQVSLYRSPDINKSS